MNNVKRAELREMSMMQDHRREQDIEGSSDRVFGFVFSTLFVVVGVWPVFYGGQLRFWALVVAAMFALLAFARPAALSGMNRAWMRFGVLMGRVVSPVALGVTYCVAILPIGLFWRLTGKDPLRLRYVQDADSYWISRDPPGPDPKTLNNQF